MQIGTFTLLLFNLIMYIHSKHHKTNGAMKNEWEQAMACDAFNIPLKTTKQVPLMFLNWDQCTSLFAASQY